MSGQHVGWTDGIGRCCYTKISQRMCSQVKLVTRGPKSLNFPDGNFQRAKTFQTKCFREKTRKPCSRQKKCAQILFVTKKCINSFCNKKVCVNQKRKLQMNAVYMAFFATCLASNFKRAVHHMFMEYVLCKACLI